ncbi:hypothetical protein BKA69DRAFT_1133639 [Paraphysoderma sedebokerense]|nr:hypothetical protein BKA69DRAFT_1133639 [Paraphysoderma sedebokerense]
MNCKRLLTDIFSLLRQLNYHLYVSPLPHTNSTKLNRQQKTIHTFFMADDLREELTKRNQELAFVVDDTSTFPSLPAEVYNYHSLYPIESSNPSSETNYFGYATQVYRATSSVDGLPYCLRKIEGFRLLNETAMTSLDPWRRIRHPSIVNVREAFTTKAFGDYSLVFVYDYHPCSTTLYTKHFAQSADSGSTPGASSSSTSRRPPAARSNSTVSSRETEAILWSYIAQICSALKAIHGAGLAARVIDPSKILVTGKNRIRLNCCGIWDMVTFENYNTKTGNSNQEDLLAFGQLLVNLACSSLTATSSANLKSSLENISRNFSAEFANFLAWLLSKPSSMKRIDDGVALISGRLMTEMDSCRAYADTLESELSKELENGRIARLLCKMGFINERPEFDMDTRWSETGDRYLIKLFRDYVFHQVDENGNPVLNMAHVLSCLNKVDVGIDERVMLMSRDERNCLIVSYKELKQCLEGAFSELLRST